MGVHLIHLPAWGKMWAIAIGMYVAFKVLVAVQTPRRAYLLVSPGFDMHAFAQPRTPIEIAWTAWAWALAKTFTGAMLMLLATRIWPAHPDFALLVGVPMFLHFGTIELVTLAWRAAGVSVRAVMDKPTRATTLAEFWGRRWNTPFHELATWYVFRPALRWSNALIATAATFIASGLVHELVITVPARGGYGQPTAYFAIQCAGLLLQRGRDWPAWLNRMFTWAVLLLPLPLLFPAAFRENILVPFAQSLSEVLR